MKESLNQERIWKIIEQNAWFDYPTTGQVLKHRDWPVFIESDGIYLRDVDGRQYMDGSSSAGCCSLGHGNRRVIEAIKEQLDRLQFATIGHSDIALLACERIAQVTPPGLNRVYLSVTGSDAVEASLAFARQYFRSQGKPNHIIITQWFSYHGSSQGSAGATGIPSMKANRGRDIAHIDSGFYQVCPPYCYRCPYGLEYPQCDILCARIIDEAISYLGPENVAGFIGEPAFCAAGGITPPPEYWPIVRGICNRHQILLIFDEVITGWGRLGKLWASEFFNIPPDIMVLGKGITAAYVPLSAMVLHDRLCEPFLAETAPLPVFVHSHSFYPLGCTAALANIEVIMEERLWENAAEVGTYLKSRLEDIARKSRVVGAVHGIGLLLGVEIIEDKQSKAPSPSLAEAINRKCAEKGLILLQMGGHHNVLNVTPPLIITREQSDTLCDILGKAIIETEAE